MTRTKKSLLMSILSLLLCLSMLLGTTYAWFTDSTSTAGNRIVSGSLKVDLLHFANDDWTSLKKNPEHKIFDYDRWEPGFTRLEKLKVENIGKLALKYQLSATTVVGTESLGPNDEKLADVIDVYLYQGDTTVTDFADIKGNADWLKAGTLSDMMRATGGFARGAVLPANSTAALKEGVTVKEQTVSIALHMQEEAGNVYQNLSLGDMHVTLVATQYDSEFDSFGSDYDKDSVFPAGKINYSVNSPVNVNSDNTVAQTVGLGSAEDSIKANVAEGTKLKEGTTYLSLSVTELTKSNANITAGDGQEARSVDVHVSGIADDNTTPILVTVNGLMPTGYNMGNFELYHVENGTDVLMTCVTEAELDAHNEYSYDPITGTVKMALCSFSEVLVVADNKAVWEGGVDYSWYNVNSKTLVIATADQLNGFGKIVGGMAPGYDIDDFKGKTVKLIYDIDLGTKEGHTKQDKDRPGKQLVFYPIGYHFTTNYNDTGAVYSTVSNFSGTFDGNGHTIANFYQNTWEMVGDYNSGYPAGSNHYKDAMGLFGYVEGGTVKNLRVDNFSSDGEFTPTGVIAAYAEHGATFENITVTNCNPRVYNTGNGGIVGIGGSSSDTNSQSYVFKNITVDQSNKITALWGSWDVSCSGIMGMFRGPSDVNNRAKVQLTNCHVAAQIDAYNDVCGNYQYYWYRYSGMLIGSIRDHVVENGYTIPNTSGITATNCTVHFGDWNNYYYCELVANSLASYTHDHQMSRLTEVKSVDVENMTYVPLGGTDALPIPTSGRVNYVVVNGTHSTENATCYHFVDGAQHMHESEGYQDVDVNGDGVKEHILVEDNQHIYLPFNKQIYQGYGWGVKNIPVEKAEGVTILDREVSGADGYSVKKFEPRIKNGEKIAVGYSINIGDIFKKTGAAIPIIDDQVQITVTKKGNASTDVEDFYDYNPKQSDKWEEKHIRFNNYQHSAGTYVITIQDYYYCTATSVEVVVEWYNKSGNTVFVWAEGDYTKPNADKYAPCVATMKEAYDKLGVNGGTIVIVGNYIQNEIFRAPAHTGNVTITAIDDISTFWIGPRTETNNVGVRYFTGGPTTFNNIRIEAEKYSDTVAGNLGEDGTSRLSWNLVGGFNDLTITETVQMDRKGNDFILVLGAQGGGQYSGAQTINVKDAKLDLRGGEWSEVVGSVRTSFTDQSHQHEFNHHMDQFEDRQYHIDISIGGNAVVDKLFGFARSLDSTLKEELDLGTIGAHASCTVNLLGGTVTRFFSMNHLLESTVGYQKGFTVYLGAGFDLDNSFNVVPDQSSVNTAKGYYVTQGLGGESVYKYAGETPVLNLKGVASENVGVNTDLMIGKSVLLVEYVEGQDRLNAIKANDKIRSDTFDYIEYGTPVEPAPDTMVSDHYFVGFTNNLTAGKGTSENDLLNSIGWKSGVYLTKPTDGGETGETDEASVSSTDKYAKDEHLWYYFDTFGGTYIAAQKMFLGGSTTVRNGNGPLTFTAVWGGKDYRTTGTDYGSFIIKARPTDGPTHYLRIQNEFILENIDVLNRANSNAQNPTQTGYFIVDKGGKLVIGEGVNFKSQHSDPTNYVVVNAGGVLYLASTGFSSYTGEGTIVLSDELIVKLNRDADGINDLNLLRAFTDQGGTITDERGIELKIHEISNGARLLLNLDGGIPQMDAGKLVYEHVVFTKTGGTGNGSSADYPLNTLNAAYKALGFSGGTVVICGRFDMNNSFHVASETAKNEYPITVTQVYDGVDYRKDANGNEHVNTIKVNPSSDGSGWGWYLYGPTKFENITFESTAGVGMMIITSYEELVIGDGFALKGFNTTTNKTSFNDYFTIVGGFNSSYNDSNVLGKKAKITINSCDVISGVGISIVGLDYAQAVTNDHDLDVTINGGKFYRIYGTVTDAKAKATGNIKYTINGGTFTDMQDFRFINAINPIVLDINGGEFGTPIKFVGAKGDANVKTGINVEFSGTVNVTND